VMRKAFTALILLFLIVSMQLSMAQQIPTRLFAPADASVEMRGGILFKTCESYLFHAQDNVVRRFDGNNWDVYAQLPDSEEITALGTHNKKMWLGTASGRLWNQQDDGFTLFEPEEGQIKAGISKILSVNGQLWVASLGDGLYCWTKNRLFRFDKSDGMPDISISDLHYYLGKIWVGTDQGLVSISFKDEKKSIRQHPTKDLLIGSLGSDSSNLWVAFQSGGISKLENTAIIRLGAGLGLVKIVIKHGKVWALDEAGNLWTILKEDQKATHFPFSFNSKALRIDDFLFDDNGFIWLSTQFGVVSSQVALRLYTFPPAMQVQSLLEQPNGTMWVGTSIGLFAWDVHEHRYELLQGTAALNVLSLHLDQQNRLWIGTFGQGLYCYNSGKLLKVGAVQGLHNANVFSMAASKNQKTLYLGTLGGLYAVDLDVRAPSKFVSAFKQTDNSGPGSFYIYQVFVDSKDRLWIGTDGMGAFMYVSNRFRQFKESISGNFRIVTTIAEDQSGAIWLSTLDRGLFKLDGSELRLSPAQSVHSKVEITSMATHLNQLLLSSTEGIEQSDLNYLHTLSINRLYGLQATEGITNALFKKGSKLWVGTKEGVISLDLAILKLHEAPALGIQLNDPDHHQKFDSVFEPSKNALSFNLTSLWGGAPDAVFMRYKLVGLHDEWVGTTKKEIYIQGLQPGTYQLLVESSLYPDFNLAQATSYGFTIKKPFYTRWWFALILLIFTGVLARLYFNGREHKRKSAENAKVEQIRAQYELLKSQVSPHFLFNSFNTLLALIDEDQKLASTYVENLAALFRSVLTYKDTDLITLKEELVLVEAYIYLQQQRFGVNLRINIDIPPEAFKKMVMPMSLQLLVENAIKHNAISTQKPLNIEISSTIKHVIVRNNLQPKAQSEPSTGFGLSSLEQRYTTLFKENLTIEATDIYFQVHLPLILAV